MALKTLLESIEGVDDAVKALYTEKDGKFILSLEGVDEHPDVANLKSAYERTKSDRDAARAERDALKSKHADFPDDFDRKQWDKMKDGKPDEAALISLRKELEGTLADRDAKIKSLEGSLRGATTERDLNALLSDAGVKDAGLLAGARAILSPQIKTSDDGKASVDTDMGPLALSEYVKRWAAGDGKSFVTPPSGGGSKGGSGGGTKKFSELNGSEKVALRRENPQEYDRLKAAG